MFIQVAKSQLTSFPVQCKITAVQILNIVSISIEREMDLPTKFEAATSSRSINISELDTDKKYPIVSAKRIITKFGPTALLTIHDSDSAAALQIFLPKRYSEVISHDDIDKINKKSVSLNLIYKGTCPKSRSYLLAIEI